MKKMMMTLVLVSATLFGGSAPSEIEAAESFGSYAFSASAGATV